MAISMTIPIAVPVAISVAISVAVPIPIAWVRRNHLNWRVHALVMAMRVAMWSRVVPHMPHRGHGEMHGLHPLPIGQGVFNVLPRAVEQIE